MTVSMRLYAAARNRREHALRHCGSEALLSATDNALLRLKLRAVVQRMNETMATC
jgi:hypothetical protein